MTDSTELPVVKGFRFGAVAAGLKPDGALDLGAIVADEAVAAAGVFTRSIVRGAPVIVAEQRVNSRPVSACLVNAGCANACTGADGVEDARDTSLALAQALGVDPREVVPASTGLIGVRLARERVRAAIPALVDGLDAGRAADFARAISTTDRTPKTAFHTDGGVTAVGIAKGGGMFHPDMATALGFIVCDGVAARRTILRALRIATDHTFNRASVNGDTSPNDTVVAMCSGRAGAKALNVTRLVSLFEPVLDRLARAIVAEGEGATHAVTIRIEGAARASDATSLARTLATSNAVKSALRRGDASGGALLAAAGRAGARFSLAHVTISVGDVVIVERGRALGAEVESCAAAVMQRDTYDITVRVGGGRFRDHFVTCDHA